MKLLLIIVCSSVLLFAQDSVTAVSVMTYNIHHGEGLNGEIDIEKIAEVIRHNKADIVALQEVDKGVERSFGIDIPDSLAKLTGMFSCFDKNINFQGGEYGNAILTKYPIISKNNLHYNMIREGEQRGLLQAVVNINGSEICFMNTHIDFRGDDTERLMNINEIKEIAGRYKIPIIICGDFNDIPSSRTHKNMVENFKDSWEELRKGNGFSYPAEEPVKRIDYIFFNNPDKSRYNLAPTFIEVLNSDASDHLPVLAEFELKHGK